MVKEKSKPLPRKRPGRETDEALNAYTRERIKQYLAEGGAASDLYARSGSIARTTYYKLRDHGRGIGLKQLGPVAEFFGMSRGEYLAAADEWWARQLEKNPLSIDRLPGFEDAVRQLTAMGEMDAADVESLCGAVFAHLKSVDLETLRQILALRRRLEGK